MKLYHVFFGLSFLLLQKQAYSQQRSFDASIPSDSFSPKEEEKIKVSLNLTPFVPMEIVDPKGRRLQETRPGKTKKYILNAALKKEKHFFIGSDYHVVLRPNKYIKPISAFAFEVSVFKKIGTDQQVEELIGDMSAEGKAVLISSSPAFFRFEGTKHKTFLDKWGKETLKVEIGETQSPQQKITNINQGQSTSY